ncbi:MAG: erythromycin esterase family protein [Armatimonadetes bacterium]|nr:erythromycin esterase family protein [Armatimonadota bacterium]
MLALTIAALLCQTQLSDDLLIESLSRASLPLKTVVAGNGFDDMALMAKSLQGVEVVGMGEPTHGSREVFQMKHRMFEYLVENHGFTVFALESNMSDTVALDRYVLYGEGSVQEAARAQGFWTWSTEEIVDLLEWMRTYNTDPEHLQKLRVVGIDMQNQATCTLYFQKICRILNSDGQAQFWEEMSWDDPTDEQMSEFADIVSRDLPVVREKVGEDAARLYERMVVVYKQAVDNNRIKHFIWARSKALPHLAETFKSVENLMQGSRNMPDGVEAGLSFLVEHENRRVAEESVDKDSFMKRALAIRKYANSQGDKAQAYTRCAEVLEFLALAQGMSGLNVSAHRDQSMAENLLWIQDTYLPGAKVMLWAHNYHVSRLLVNDKPMMTGAFLAESLGEKYFPVGFSFYEGGFRAVGTDGKLKAWSVPAARKGSIDEAFKRVGYCQFFIDFGQLDETGRKWASQLHSTRNYGAVNNEAQADSYWGEITPGQMYAGMIFIAKTKPARAID